MNLKDEALQIEAYSNICNYDGKLVADSLLRGIDDILSGKATTVDAYCSNREELENRISAFYQEIDHYLTISI